jgi:hypothetical protein
VGASSFNADSLAGFSEDSGGRVAGNVPPVMFGVATWEEVNFASVGLPDTQERSQIFNHWDGAGCQFAFGCRFPDIYRGSNPTRRGVNVFSQHRAGFGNASGCVEANSEQRSIAIGLQSLSKQQLYLRV